MVPPPVTPSPHRFVIKKPRVPLRSQQPSPLSNAQQFNAPPRFSFAPPRRSNVESSLYSPSTQSLTESAAQCPTLARPAREVQGTIEEASDETSINTHQSVKEEESHSTPGYVSIGEDDEQCDLIANHPKRRRLSSIVDSQSVDISKEYDIEVNETHYDGFEDLLSSGSPIISSPTAAPLHRQPGSTTAPRFIIPLTPVLTPASTLAPVLGTTFLKAPRFRPPNDQSQNQRSTEPLPEQFSPHRRGRKFLAGGLAAEVVGWVMNLESSNSSAPEHSSTYITDSWPVEIVVDEVRGGHGAGMTLIRGRQVHTSLNGQSRAEVMDNFGVWKVILAGNETTGEGFQRAVKVDVGRLVRMKGPLWEVVLEGQRWGVGVTWQVLD